MSQVRDVVDDTRLDKEALKALLCNPGKSAKSLSIFVDAGTTETLISLRRLEARGAARTFTGKLQALPRPEDKPWEASGC